MESSYTWYQTLIKPFWAPPSWLFGPVWTVLYIIIAYTFISVFYKVATKQIPWFVALPFALNLLFNFAFTPLQFTLKNNFLASIDIFFVVGTLVWALKACGICQYSIFTLVYICKHSSAYNYCFKLEINI